MEPQVAALQNMFSLILYGAFGFLAPSIVMWSNLDSLQDQFTSPSEQVDSYDFIVGMELRNSSLFIFILII